MIGGAAHELGQELAKYAFHKKDVGMLRGLIPQLEARDAAASKRAQLFLKIAKQWDAFSSPALVAAGEKQV